MCVALAKMCVTAGPKFVWKLSRVIRPGGVDIAAINCNPGGCGPKKGWACSC